MQTEEKTLLRLEDILTNPATVASVHRGQMAVLRHGTIEERREIAPLHFLKLHLGEEYNAVVTESVLAALREKVKTGECDRLLLDEIEKNGILTFETLKGDKTTGFHVYDRGSLVIATHVVGSKAVARTMYSIFNDPARQHHAALGQRYMHAIAEYAKQAATDEDIIRILNTCATMEPTYSKDGLLGNLFLAGAKDLHDVLKKSDLPIEDRYTLLRDKAAVDLVLGFYANAFEQSTAGKRFRKQNGKQAFKPVDHKRLVYEKAFMRASQAFRNRMVREGIADADGNIISSDSLQKLDGTSEARLVQALGLEGTEGMTFVHGDNLPPNTMVSHDKAHGISFTPIDFEFAGRDYTENSLVQCWMKSGMYDHEGKSALLPDGRSLEDALLHDSVGVMRRLNHDFDEGTFRQRFARLKAENYLLWAARYHHYADNRRVRNPEENRTLARYYHTLFIREMERQGICNDDVRACSTTLFGETLDDAAMRAIHEQHLPEKRSHSVLRMDLEADAEVELEGMIRQYASRRKRRKAGIVATAAGLAALFIGGIGFAVHQRQQEIDTNIAGLTEIWDEYSPAITPVIGRTHTRAGKEIQDSSKFRHIRDLLTSQQAVMPLAGAVPPRDSPDTIDVMVAYLLDENQEEGVRKLRLVQKIAESKSFEGYSPYLPDDVNYRAKVFTQGYTDNFRDQALREARNKARSTIRSAYMTQVRSFLEQDSYRHTDGIVRNTSYIHKSLIADTTQDWAVALSEGRLSREEMVTHDEVVNLARNRVSPYLVDAILDEYEFQNPYLRLHGYEGLTFFDIELRNEKPSVEVCTNWYYDTITPREHAVRGIDRLASTLAHYCINPLSPFDKPVELERALRVFFSLNTEVEEAQKEVKRSGGRFEDYLPSPARSAAYNVIYNNQSIRTPLVGLD